MKPRPVMVIWLDACVSLNGDNLEPERTITLGFLVANKSSGLVVATDWCESMGAHGEARHMIPRGMIEDWWYLDIQD